MKKSDLYREWARVLDMCELTKVKPESCWKYAGFKTDQHIPEFAEDYNKYEFAVAILEGKPVFVGDRIWLKSIGAYSIVPAKEALHTGITDEYCSWVEPKKTFMIDGVELPSPRPYRVENGNFLIIAGTKHNYYAFDKIIDRNRVERAIVNILEDASK